MECTERVSEKTPRKVVNKMKIKDKHATVGRLSDITKRAYIENKGQTCHSRASERHRIKGI